MHDCQRNPHPVCLQEAAVEAWQAAAEGRDKGKSMSREDLASFFERAHTHDRPIPRPSPPKDPTDYTVKFGGRAPQVLLTVTICGDGLWSYSAKHASHCCFKH